jgi:chemotaxis-related protein WspD
MKMLEVQDCWNKIGVTGDRSCPQLTQFIHCRNCPVYSAAGRGLLEREAPEGYLNQWTDLLSQTQLGIEQTISQDQLDSQTISVIIFRLGGEWFALPAKFFKEVTHPCVIHTVPHRTNQIFRGIVSIRGEIMLCVALDHLLGLQSIPTDLKSESKLELKASTVVYERMVVVEVEQKSWVFAVDEIYSIQRFNIRDFRETPSVIAKAAESYTKAVINWNQKKVNYLDYELLFYTLNKKIV